MRSRSERLIGVAGLSRRVSLAIATGRAMDLFLRDEMGATRRRSYHSAFPSGNVRFAPKATECVAAKRRYVQHNLGPGSASAVGDWYWIPQRKSMHERCSASGKAIAAACLGLIMCKSTSARLSSAETCASDTRKKWKRGRLTDYHSKSSPREGY